MEENIQAFIITEENRGAVGFTENTRDLVIPDTFVGDGTHDTVKGQKYHVTGICNGAFQKTKLKSVFMPDSITKIGSRAFYFCKQLETIRLSQNLEDIQDEAFSYNFSLKSIKLPSKIKKIRKAAFYSTDLHTVDTSEAINLQNIGSNAFSECVKLKNFDLPAGLRTLAASAFLECRSLETVDSESKFFTSINGQILINQQTQQVLWISPKAKYVFIPHEIKKISPSAFFNCPHHFFHIVIDHPKDSFPEIHWPRTAHIYWIG